MNKKEIIDVLKLLQDNKSSYSKLYRGFTKRLKNPIKLDSFELIEYLNSKNFNNIFELISHLITLNKNTNKL